VNFIKAPETSRTTINDWIEETTRKKIKELIKPGTIGPLTRLILTNAIYFKGNWELQFKKESTVNAPFHLPDRRQVDAPMMHQKDRFPYLETDDMQILELPYAGSELSMVILLPRERDGLEGIENALAYDELSRLLMKLRKREVKVIFPKFSLTSEFDLSKILSSMGMADAFSQDAANLSGITVKGDLYISAVVHKAFVDVNEEGTEAAAATGVTMALASISPVPLFRADHPFMFMIREVRSGSILFLGRVTNPVE
jgi:serpin B